MIEIIHKKNKLDKILEFPPPVERPVKNYEQSNVQCEAFCEWLDNAMPGDKFRYHVGQYVSGKKVAALVSRAYEKGIVTMYQSKGEVKNTYNYWVMKVNPKKIK